jgi:hypothetical protein
MPSSISSSVTYLIVTCEVSGAGKRRQMDDLQSLGGGLEREREEVVDGVEGDEQVRLRTRKAGARLGDWSLGLSGRGVFIWFGYR